MPGKSHAFGKGQTKSFQTVAHWTNGIAPKSPFLMTLIQRRRLIAQKKTWSCTARWSREADWGITWRDSRQNQVGLANCGISFWFLQLIALNSLSKVASSMNHRKIPLLRGWAIWMRVEFSYFWKFWSRILSGQGTLRLGTVSRPGTGMFRLCFTFLM